MGYGVMVYLVDTSELLSLVGSGQPTNTDRKSMWRVFFPKKDKASKLSKIFKAELDDLDESIFEDQEDGLIGETALTLTARQVLDEFLTNRIADQSDFGFVYGYIFKLLCAYKGESLGNSQWYRCDSRSYVGIPFTNMSLPVAFPTPDDFPWIMHVNYEDIDLRHAEYLDMDEQQKQEVVSWFTVAIQSKKDLYLFYH